MLVGGRQNEIDQVVTLPFGGVVVEQVHEVGDDPLHVAPLVEEHGHAPRGRGLCHRWRQLLQYHRLHGHRCHATFDERKQCLFGQIGVHAGETQRGEHEFALGEHLVAARERLVVERAHARDLTHGRALAGSRKPNAVEGPHIHDIADGDHRIPSRSCRFSSILAWMLGDDEKIRHPAYQRTSSMRR